MALRTSRDWWCLPSEASRRYGPNLNLHGLASLYHMSRRRVKEKKRRRRNPSFIVRELSTEELATSKVLLCRQKWAFERAHPVSWCLLENTTTSIPGGTGTSYSWVMDCTRSLPLDHRKRRNCSLHQYVHTNLTTTTSAAVHNRFGDFILLRYV